MIAVDLGEYRASRAHLGRLQRYRRGPTLSVDPATKHGSMFASHHYVLNHQLVCAPINGIRTV